MMGPAVRKSLVRLAHGQDRSAAPGNGVVPMAAAHAFKELMKELSTDV